MRKLFFFFLFIFIFSFFSACSSDSYDIVAFTPVNEESHEGAMLRSRDALDVDGVVEVAEVFVGLADAIVLGTVAILDVSHAPGVVTNQLEGA